MAHQRLFLKLRCFRNQKHIYKKKQHLKYQLENKIATAISISQEIGEEPVKVGDNAISQSTPVNVTNDESFLTLASNTQIQINQGDLDKLTAELTNRKEKLIKDLEVLQKENGLENIKINQNQTLTKQLEDLEKVRDAMRGLEADIDTKDKTPEEILENILNIKKNQAEITAKKEELKTALSNLPDVTNREEKNKKIDGSQWDLTTCSNLLDKLKHANQYIKECNDITNPDINVSRHKIEIMADVEKSIDNPTKSTPSLLSNDEYITNVIGAKKKRQSKDINEDLKILKENGIETINLSEDRSFNIEDKIEIDIQKDKTIVKIGEVELTNSPYAICNSLNFFIAA